ncbi:MAG: hypothetical protein WB523_16640 [Candidatus Sulfotelmatobacter sp.]
MTTTVKIICAPMPDHAAWVRSRNAITYQAESSGGTVTTDEGREIVIAVEFEDPIKAGEFASWWNDLTGRKN